MHIGFDINVRTLMLLTFLAVICHCYFNCKRRFMEYFSITDTENNNK